MRRLNLLAAAHSLLVLVTSATAARIVGTNCADTIRGTPRADFLYGRAGNDVLNGLGGNDRIFPGPGKDRVRCGAGRDFVQADAVDVVAPDCETVKRPAPPKPKAKPGTRENPHRIRTPAPLPDDWTLQVVSTTPNANAVRARREPVQRPPGRRQSVLPRAGLGDVHGDGRGLVRRALPAPLGWPVGRLVQHVRQRLRRDPDELLLADVFTGGTITGNVCWQIRSSDEASLVLYDDSLVGDTMTFFALR